MLGTVYCSFFLVCVETRSNGTFNVKNLFTLIFTANSHNSSILTNVATSFIGYFSEFLLAGFYFRNEKNAGDVGPNLRSPFRILFIEIFGFFILVYGGKFFEVLLLQPVLFERTGFFFAQNTIFIQPRDCSLLFSYANVAIPFIGRKVFNRIAQLMNTKIAAWADNCLIGWGILVSFANLTKNIVAV